MPRSGYVSVPRRLSYELEDALPRAIPEELQSPDGPREYDSWPGDSFFLLPDTVLAMDASAFRADLKAIDPVLSASLPDWPLEPKKSSYVNGSGSASDFTGPSHTKIRATSFRDQPPFFTLLDNHEGLTVRSVGRGTVLIGGGVDGGGFSSTAESAPSANATDSPASTTTNGPHNAATPHKSTPTNSSQKDPEEALAVRYQESLNEQFFGAEQSSGLSYKDREDRVRQLRERQQIERQQKLEELKEQAASAQRFREQQETARRQRLDEMRCKDFERRTQVEERKKLIQQAEQQRREAVLRKSAEREQRLDHKRRQERSNAVFAFGSSTPRMLDPKESQNYWGARRATSTTNVNMSDSTTSIRRTSECQDSDLSRKRATSAHSLNRKPEDVRMSTSMYEVFNWDNADVPASPKSHAPGEEPSLPRAALVTTAARRRTDLMPSVPSIRDVNHRSPGMRSGTNTPSSRPNSALSHASGSSQVMLRNKASPKKPRPLSIAGSVPSAADKPRHAVTVSPSRESRSIERKTSVGGTAPGAAKGSRAKSVGSDRSAPSTPSKSASRGTTPKRTPAQVKAESAARKASKAKSTPKAPLVNSLSLESKTEKKSKTSTQTGKVSSKPSSKESSSTDLKVSSSTPLVQKPEEEQSVPEVMKVELDTETIKNNSQEVVLESNETLKPVDPETEDVLKVIVNDPIEAEEVSKVEQIKETPKIEVNVDLQDNVSSPSVSVEDKVVDVKTTVQIPSSEQEVVVVVPESTTDEIEEEKSRLQKAAEKPVTGYATEEQYKAALAEKRRQAREAKERELELEKQRQLEEEERERKEEEEYLKLIEDQKKAEEIRLQKAIQEAEKQRQEDRIKAEEEEKLRIETEKVELQKKLEQEERMKREEEERQLRKSRVAAIMSRTRGKGSSTPTKTESKTPSDETKGVMSESFISNISSSMTDSMIVQAIESREENKKSDDAVSLSSQATSDLSSQPLSGFSSQPPSDVSSNAANTLEMSSQPSSGIHSDCGSTVSQDTEKDEAEKYHRNGNSPVDTTPTIDLLGGSINGVNGVNHNGVQLSDQPDNLLGSFDPLNSTETTSSSKSESTTFDQIIDLNQSKLTNEDAVNSNSAPPHPPIIAFEDNLNKKSNQDTSSNVPDLLL